jgi:hypothetical protein
MAQELEYKYPNVCVPKPHLSGRQDSSRAETHPQLLLKEVRLLAPAWGDLLLSPVPKGGVQKILPPTET